MAIRERTGVSARELTTIQVGGICKTVLDVTSETDIIGVFDRYPQAICIGGGSNLLISQQGVTDPIVRIYADDSAIRIDESTGLVNVDASVGWDVLVQRSLAAGLAGLECMSGIPGTAGGGVVQNVGAYGQEIADVFVSLRAYDREKGEIVEIFRDEVGFSYRNSRFKHDPSRRFVVTSIELQMQHSLTGVALYDELAARLGHDHGAQDQYQTKHIRQAVLAIRKSKGMLVEAGAPSAGSFFTNPEITLAQLEAIGDQPGVRVLKQFPDRVRISAAALIAASGFQRGMHHSGAGISEQHMLAIVNNGDATADDIIALGSQIRSTVFEHFGVTLEPEPVLLGFDENPFPQLV